MFDLEGNGKMRKIGYKVGGVFDDVCMNSRDVGFDILFPKVYDSYEEAENAHVLNSAKMEKQEDGSVVIVLYESKIPVDTIRWDEWWKYKCFRIKEASKNLGSVNGHTDYEPYCGTFEEIFDEYICMENTSVWGMQHLAYWVEPVVIEIKK